MDIKKLGELALDVVFLVLLFALVMVGKAKAETFIGIGCVIAGVRVANPGGGGVMMGAAVGLFALLKRFPLAALLGALALAAFASSCAAWTAARPFAARAAAELADELCREENMSVAECLGRCQDAVQKQAPPATKLFQSAQGGAGGAP